MKVLVTGANGQVGSELLRQGNALGLQMMAAGSGDLDITQAALVEAYIARVAPDVVINAAAYTAVDKAEEQVERAYAVNRDGPANLAKTCADASIPLLHISTDYVFDGAQRDPYAEGDQPNPTTVYGCSKLAGEQAVAAHGGDFVILRVAWVFGAHGNNFVRTMLRLGAERTEMNIVADQRGGPTWAGDIAAVLLGLAQRLRDGAPVPAGIYHYAGQPATSWYAFAAEIFRQAEGMGLLSRVPRLNAITTDAYPTPARRPLNSVLACQKIADTFGVTQPDWRVGLQHVLSEWKSQ